MKTSSELKIISQFQSKCDKILNVNDSARISMKSIGIIGRKRTCKNIKFSVCRRYPFFIVIFIALHYFRIFSEIMRQPITYLYYICMYNIKQSFELYCERAVIMICGSESRCDEDGIGCNPG